jgi:succinate dehydrogenase / fumarate reductase cytochrome b subunit
MSTTNRPLSPHLQIYRPQLTSVLSISHRIAGLVLSAGSLLLTAWLVALAAGPESFASFQSLVGSVFGRLVLFVLSLALFFHLCNGIRHLFWDAGRGFELQTAYASGKAVIVASLALTVLTWLIGYVGRGA